MAKGVVITLGIVLLAGVLIVSIALISKNQISHDKTMSFLAENELIFGLDISLENSLGLLFKDISNINITTKKGSIEISESFPYTNNILPYIKNLNKLLEENIPWVIVNATSFEYPQLEFEEGSIYSHNNNFNSLYLKEFDNLALNIKIPGGITGCNYILEPGEFRLTINAIADNGTCYINELIDLDKTNRLDIVTETAVTNILLENRRVYIGNSSFVYNLKIITNNTIIFLKDAYNLGKKGRFKTGKVKIN